MSGTTETKETKETKGIKAKDASLAGKITGAVVLVAGGVTILVLRLIKIIPDNETMESMFSVVAGCAFSLLGVFGTVDVNLMLEKLTRRKEQ